MHTKHSCVIFYNLQQEFPKLQENKQKNRTSSVVEPVVVELESQSLESADFPTVIQKDTLQDKIVETSNRINETITENRQRMEIDFKKNLQNELKEIQTKILIEVHNMIQAQMKLLTLEIKSAIQSYI